MLQKVINQDKLETWQMENRLHARMIDGRSIHFYIQYIEPKMIMNAKTRWPDIACAAGDHVRFVRDWYSVYAWNEYNYRKRLRSVTYKHSALTKLPLGSRSAFLKAADESCFNVDSCEEEAILNEAITALRDVGMDYFLELGIGLFLLTVGTSVTSKTQYSSPGALPLNLKMPSTNIVTEMACGAAREFLWQWLETECAIQGNRDVCRDVPFFKDLVDVFSLCVLVEYFRRALDNGMLANYDLLERSIDLLPRTGDEMIRWLNSYPGLPASKELICCWYPNWNRAQFIMKSPLDGIVDLSSVGSTTGFISDILQFSRRGIEI